MIYTVISTKHPVSVNQQRHFNGWKGNLVDFSVHHWAISHKTNVFSHFFSWLSFFTAGYFLFDLLLSFILGILITSLSRYVTNFVDIN